MATTLLARQRVAKLDYKEIVALSNRVLIRENFGDSPLEILIMSTVQHDLTWSSLQKAVRTFLNS